MLHYGEPVNCQHTTEHLYLSKQLNTVINNLNPKVGYKQFNNIIIYSCKSPKICIMSRWEN